MADRFDFTGLEHFLRRVPAIEDSIGKGADNGLWWVKFSIDIDHARARRRRPRSTER